MTKLLLHNIETQTFLANVCISLESCLMLQFVDFYRAWEYLVLVISYTSALYCHLQAVILHSDIIVVNCDFTLPNLSLEVARDTTVHIIIRRPRSPSLQLGCWRYNSTTQSFPYRLSEIL